ncbi:MAG: glycosyltransferase family A protein [Acidimicrobiia bacterium]
MTIGLLVHNAERTMRETIESVLAQTYENFTLVLSDDASTDTSVQICRDYSAADSRVRVQAHAENLGGIGNFNSVVAGADDGYFVWLSDHDLWLPEYLDACVSALEARPDAVLCYTAQSTIDVAGTETAVSHEKFDTCGQNQKARFALTAWGVPANTACIYGVLRVGALRQLRSFPNIYPSAVAPDVLLLLQLAMLGEFLHIDRPLYQLRTLSDHHSTPRQYLARLRLTPRSRLDALRSFGRMVLLGVSDVWFYAGSWRKRAILVPTFLLAITRYEILLDDMLKAVGDRR